MESIATYEEIWEITKQIHKISNYGNNLLVMQLGTYFTGHIMNGTIREHMSTQTILTDTSEAKSLRWYGCL